MTHDVLMTIARLAAQHFNARSASIALVEDKELVFVAVGGPDVHRDLVGARFPISEGIAGFVARSGEAVLSDDLEHETRFSEDIATATGFMPERILAVPLTHQGRTYGVLSVLDRATYNKPDEDLALATRFAAQAGVAAAARTAALDITR